MTPLGFVLPFGARIDGDSLAFRLWSPGSRRVDVVIETDGASEVHALTPEADGYFGGRVPGAGAGTRYRFRLDEGEAFPDPASRYQPEGVHGPSEAVDPAAFRWSDEGWAGVRMENLILYELHVGTFTPEGTFDAAAERLGELAELGVSAIEVMPIANFPGSRNWGYDGVNLFAPATAYGGPEGFKRLVDAAHAHGLGVVLDVVYNHLGPEGNYLPAVTHGHYLTDRHQTPWGDAINFDGPESAAVRDFVLHNALYWALEYHVDGLRLDATHAIVDDSPRHILEEIAAALHALPDHRRLVIAEDERNERRMVLPPEEGGLGMDGVWADDLHHQLRRLSAGDHEGYFASYSGTTGDLAATLRKGWFYEGQTTPTSGKARGTPADGIWPPRFVHCLQNHDQVGNRAFGERLNHEIPLPLYRALSTLLLFSPYTPLLWMGQEWAASSPFLYFTDHPAELGKLVTAGRREEFGHFSAFRDEELRETIPDPQAPETLTRSRLDWSERSRAPHDGVLRLYRDLLTLRRSEESLRDPGREGWSLEELGEAGLAIRREGEGSPPLLLLVVFRGEVSLSPDERPETAAPEGRHWLPVLVSEDLRYGGSGAWGRLEADGSVHLVGPVAVVLRAE
jgi:maltooligosyltrehalose trehalohydrolase